MVRKRAPKRNVWPKKESFPEKECKAPGEKSGSFGRPTRITFLGGRGGHEAVETSLRTIKTPVAKLGAIKKKETSFMFRTTVGGAFEGAKLKDPGHGRKLWKRDAFGKKEEANPYSTQKSCRNARGGEKAAAKEMSYIRKTLIRPPAGGKEKEEKCAPGGRKSSAYEWKEPLI